jgi:hypothetical protein
VRSASRMAESTCADSSSVGALTPRKDSMVVSRSSEGRRPRCDNGLGVRGAAKILLAPSVPLTSQAALYAPWCDICAILQAWEVRQSCDVTATY